MDHDSQVLASISDLCDAGFACHWLHPRAKRPIGKEWQDAPRATLASLTASHARGNNLGVRLGEPSLLTCGGYLHALDFDIRVGDLGDEAWDAFHALLPSVDPLALPCVASGSGGESRHLYFVTDKPFFSKKLAVSEGKHRRWDADRKKDVWSCDWEIDLFGTGKQVVLPPSIHPDTKLPYLWVREFDFDMLDLGAVPFIPSAVIEALGVAETSEYQFESREPLTFAAGQMDRELDLLEIAHLDIYEDWITLGAAIHHQLGGSDAGFHLWLHHSKRSTKFDGDERTMLKKWRSFGKNRRAPVTMATVRLWANESRAANYRYDAFDEESDEGDCNADCTTSAEAPQNVMQIALQADNFDPFDDLFGSEPADPQPEPIDPIDAALDGGDPADHAVDLDWTSLLQFNEKGGVTGTLHNIELVVKNDMRLVGLAQINEFTQEIVQRTPPGLKNKRRKNAAKGVRQLGGRVWEVSDTLNGELWSDDRDFAIRSVLEAPETQGGYGIKISDRDLKAAIALAANDHAFHPVREYLESTEWDGIPRADTLWIAYLSAPDDCYHRDVARLMLVAAVTRIFEPGHKFDFATILEGLQGKRKSTLISVLGRRWAAELDGDFHDPKQMIEMMQGAWILELPELTGFQRSDVRAIKAFISRQKDRARMAYARRAGEFPRQCIFIGSTNDREYLKDDTGGRRFWPVECRLPDEQEIDTDHLETNVTQIWAEAVSIYRAMRAAKPKGTLPLYLTNPESRIIAARLQESRRVESPDDVLAGRIAEWLDRPVNDGGFEGSDDTGAPAYRNETCTAQIWVECMAGDVRSFKTQEQGMVNRAMLRVEGWSGDGSQHRFNPYGKQRVFYRGGQRGKLARMGLEDLLD